MRKVFILAVVFFFMATASAQNLRQELLANKSVIYVINIRSFNSQDTDKSGIIEMEKGEIAGNFINAIDRLDNIKAQGINTLHLLPVTKVGKQYALGTAGSLYSMASFTELDRLIDDKTNDFNVKEEAKFFVDECHKRDLKVIFDMPACGSYDLFLERPELFVTDKDKNPVVPMDWSDVRLFKVLDEKGELYRPTYEAYKSYVDLLLELGADGIRADVATNKPYKFWSEIIKYTRNKNPDFLFLAEASETWKTPIAKQAVFTSYENLLQAGFDGYLGSLFDLKNFKSFDLNTYMSATLRNIKKYKEPKTLIGGFSTHDEKSPVTIAGEAFARQILWLNVSLPLNPYFVDGFDTNDRYVYRYCNRKAVDTYTDCDRYYVQQGKFDIFNLAAKPNGGNQNFSKEFKEALLFREKYIDIIAKGEFIPLKSNNNSVFAFCRKNKTGAILVIASKNPSKKQNVDINVKGLRSFKNIQSVTKDSASEISKEGLMNFSLNPLDIKVFIFSK
jgi:glycosidase